MGRTRPEQDGLWRPQRACWAHKAGDSDALTPHVGLPLPPQGFIQSLNISVDPDCDWGYRQVWKHHSPTQEPACCRPLHTEGGGLAIRGQSLGKGPRRQGWDVEAHLPLLLELQISSGTTVESVGFIMMKAGGNSAQKWPLRFRNTLEEHADKIHRQHTDPLTEGIPLNHV